METYARLGHILAVYEAAFRVLEHKVGVHVLIHFGMAIGASGLITSHRSLIVEVCSGRAASGWLEQTAVEP